MSPAIDGVTVSVPPAAETLSHDTFSPAVQCQRAGRHVERLRGRRRAALVAVNDRLDGDTVSVGTGGGPLQVTEVVMSDWSAGAASARL